MAGKDHCRTTAPDPLNGNAIFFETASYVYHLVYHETFDSPLTAIAREKELKGWTRAKKEALIATQNPGWRFLEEGLCG